MATATITKQLTKEEAIAFHDSRQWESMTYEELFYFQVVQDKLCIPLDLYKRAAEATLCRPIMSIEIGSPHLLLAEYAKKLEK
ncbi:MAG TPA: hypothetical protein PL173_13300 [Saprospiraceae bacterium]|nr:hypothetical protein [Saprospiraceae bacterium]